MDEMLRMPPAGQPSHKQMYYLATPIGDSTISEFKPHADSLTINLQLAAHLQRAGFNVFLPQRDVDQRLPGRDILAVELCQIKGCSGLIAILANTRGVYIEAGYAKALGKLVIALKTPESREMSDWGYAFFDFVATDVDELIEYLKHREIVAACT
jgi:nucleoside 2-deoxyribosyltransferase